MYIGGLTKCNKIFDKASQEIICQLIISSVIFVHTILFYYNVIQLVGISSNLLFHYKLLILFSLTIITNMTVYIPNFHL